MATPRAKPIRLSVSNFGPIVNANVDLRPMTVFVGPSNTGKSYLAILVYALHRFFNAYVGARYGYGRAFVPPIGSRHIPALPSESFTLSKDDVRDLQDWAKETHALAKSPTDMLDIPEPVAAMLSTMVKDVSHLGKSIEYEILRCFGMDATENIVRYGKSESKISLFIDAPSSSNEYEVTATRRGTEMRASIASMPSQIAMQLAHAMLWDLLDDNNFEDEAEKEVGAFHALGNVARYVASSIVGAMRAPTYYLPADRGGVMHAHQLAVRGIISRASNIALRGDYSTPELSGVLGDFLEQLVELAGPSPRFRRPRQEYDDLASSLEQTIMRGAVRVERGQIAYPSFAYRPDGWQRDLPLMNASSMVSELTPVALYLRHVIRPGNLLIIEEPESHLHPEMQVQFTRQLAAAVHAGVRIIITTHSEWVLNELANLVRMSKLSDAQRKELDAPNLALSPDQVGAWLFEPDMNEAGSVVKKMPLDDDTGEFSPGFSLLTEDLYNRWANITNRINEIL